MKQEDEANLDANAVRVAVAAVEEQDNDDDQDVEDKDKQIFDDMVYLAEAKRLLDEQRKAQAESSSDRDPGCVRRNIESQATTTRIRHLRDRFDTRKPLTKFAKMRLDPHQRYRHGRRY